MNQTANNPPPQAYYPPLQQDDELDLRMLFGILWRGKWLIISACLLAGIAGYLYARTLPDIYVAQASLAPSNGLGGGQQGNLSGLASLAGISLGGGGSSQTAMAREILQSRPFLADFAERHELVPQLMAAKEWDRRTKSIIFNRERYNPETTEWIGDAPTRVAIAGRLRQGMSYSQASSGLVQLSFEHVSPEFSEQVVRLLVQDLNDHMRNIDIQKAQSRIDYLEEQIQATRLAEMQQVFFQLIEGETRTIMLANVSPEYVFQMIDPPVVPSSASQPNRRLILLISLVAGGLFGVLASFIIAFVRDSQP